MPITVQNLCYSYNPGLPSEREALCGISFTAERGEITAILGHTGSGKSTLAQHLNGLIIPQRGGVFIDGLDASDPKNLRSIRKKTGLVFQYPEEQIFAETIRAEIAFAPQNWGFSKEEVDAAVKRAAICVGLGEEMLDRSPYNISGGQKRRVAIASVISARPDYLVLDEPTAGLDADSSEKLLAMLAAFAADGMGVILITHDIDTALTYASKIMVLEGGRAVSLRAPDDTAELLCARGIKGLVLPEILDLANMLRKSGRIKKLAWTPDTLIKELNEKNDIG